MKSPEVQLKKFSLTKQKSTTRTDYEGIGKSIFKKSDKKTEN